jgi:hypothetical protein
MMCGGIDEEVFSKFEQDEKGLYYNKRLDNESERRTNYVQSRRKNLACEKKESDISHMDSHMGAHMESHMENRNENENIDKKRKTRNTKNENPLFVQFYDRYPKKVAKIAAEKAFEKLKVDEALLNKMLLAIEKQKKTLAWTKDNGEFIPHPATWLNSQRWEDEIQATNNQNFKGVEYSEEQLSQFEDDPNELLARYKEGRE